MMEVNEKFNLAREYVDKTSINIFLTGKAGTGKTTFLRQIVETSHKRLVVAAPTGVAAINAGGVTLHSFFQLPFGLCLPEFQHIQTFNKEGYKFQKRKLKIIRSMELLIIDEVSMVRADMLDEIDNVLKKLRRNSQPFGGVQVLMIGDMQQLPPVVRNEEWEIMRKYYNSPYFFDSKVLRDNYYVSIEFNHIYRQSDPEFISILEAVRENKMTPSIIEKLNERYNPNVEVEKGSIILATHNRIADAINAKQLGDINEKTYEFKARVVNNFPEHLYPQEEMLTLKKGAQVMFTKNDPSQERSFVNGTLGVVTFINKDTIQVLTDKEDLIDVEIACWENLKYAINDETKEIESDIDGLFYQYPLKLAWSITIHKSQGLTFDKAVIDAGASFSHGQVYVALSRCRTLEGMTLRTKIQPHSVITDHLIADFSEEVVNNAPSQDQLALDRKKFFLNQVVDLFDLTTLKRYFFTFRKFAEAAGSNLYPKAVQELADASPVLISEFFDVSDTFCRSLNRLVTDDYLVNEHLQERIKKASVYFKDKGVEKLVPLITLISDFSFDGKNEVRLYKSYFESLAQETAMKVRLWEYTVNGFNLDSYHKKRASVIIDISDIEAKKLVATKKKEKVVDKEDSIDIKNEKLYGKLVQWRAATASKKNIPTYAVTHQKTLITIANAAPKSLQEMEGLKGVGKRFMENYAEEVLKLCR